MNQPVVIDNGSGLIKAGFAGENFPKCIFRNCVGRPKHDKVMPGGLEGDRFIGNLAEQHRGILSLRYPIEHGIVENWDDMEHIWKYLYTKDQLHSKSSEHPVLLTEAPNNPIKNREKAAEIMFEHLSVPALFVSIQAVLALYASGRTTGCVLDSGDGVTHAVPVYEGYALNESVQRVDIAGRDVTKYLKLWLRKEGHVFSSTAEMETVRTIKEQCCFLATDMNKAVHQATKAYMDMKKNPEVVDKSKKKDMKNQGQGDASSAQSENFFNPELPRTYTLPDGKRIDLYTSRFRAPEVLFRPDLLGQEEDGIHKVVYNCIQKSDLDIRSSLYQNIVLSGGTTLFHGFGSRLFGEMKELIDDQEVKLKIHAMGERIFSTWVGGSILAGLSTFKRMWITKEDYENEGSRRLYLKGMM